MRHVKYSNKPLILNNSDFQTIMIKVIFPFRRKEEDLAKMNLLPSMLNYMNNKYKTENEFITAKKELYILNTSCFRRSVGKDGIFSFNMMIPDTKSLKVDMLEEQFEFFKNFIYNPKVDDNGFDEFELNREIKNLNMGIDNMFKNVESYHNYKLKDLVDDQGILSDSLVKHRELIDEVNSKNLYEYYLDVITNNTPLIAVFGNVDNDKINELCNKYLYLNKFDTEEFDVNLDFYLKPRGEVLRIDEESNFKDSFLTHVYKIKDMCEDDIVGLNLINDLLCSSSSRMLTKKLREENELVYSNRCNVFDNFGCFSISSLINKNNRDLCEEKMFEVIEDLKNIDNINDYLENIKERKRVNLVRILDNKFMLFEDHIVKEIGFDITSFEQYEKIVKVSAEDIVNLVNRFVLDTVYFLKEEENE